MRRQTTPRSLSGRRRAWGRHPAVGARSGWRSDDAGDQREDDARSVVFDTPPLDQAIEILGAPTVELEIAADRPQANLIVRLCDVHPDGASLRVSYGVLNLTHRDSDKSPAPLCRGNARASVSG